jgi:predicted enzyme related to lactoylglutathione lyase
MPNPVVRWQIISPEPDKTTGFFQKLFQWTVSAANGLGYREMTSGETRGADGGVWPAPPGQSGMVQLFAEVENVAECVARATRLGATVVVPPAVLPDGDSMAVLLDPTGIPFGICTLLRTLPAASAGEPRSQSATTSSTP